MRLRHSPALVIAALIPAVTAPAVGHAAAPPHPAEAGRESCARTAGKDFPIEARIQDGPARYRTGDTFQDWKIALKNGGHTVCRHIHPVLVLVDKDRRLKAAQVRLEFRDGTRWRPVRMESTDHDETVGVFDGFPGLTVRPAHTVTVPVRMSLAADAVPEDVTAQAAVVQRHGDDGDWVGESKDYRFTIVQGASGVFPDTRSTPGDGVTAPDGGTDAGTDARTDPGNGTDPGTDPGTGIGSGDTTGGTDPGAGAVSGSGDGSGEGVDGGPDYDPGFGPGDDLVAGASQGDPGRLAMTGSRSLRPLGVAAGVLILCGAALVALTGRPRGTRRWGNSD